MDRRALVVGLLLVGAASLGGCGLKAKLAEGLLHPSRDVPAKPDDYGLDYESVRISTGRDTDVHGWFVPSARSTGETVVLFHGDGTSIGYYHPYVRFLHRAGFHVFLYDYRGYGSSKGEASTDALFDDLEPVLAWLVAHPSIDAGRLGFYGISLGSIVAMRAASDYPGVRAVVVENCVSPDAAVGAYLQRSIGWAVRWAVVGVLDAFVLPWNIEPTDTVDDFGAPVLLIQGADDRITAPTTALAVASAAPERTSVWIVPDAGHAPDTLDAHEREVHAAVAGFFRGALGDGAPVARVDVGAARAREAGFATPCRVRVAPTTDERRAVELALGLADGAVAFRRVWVVGAAADVVVETDAPIVWAHAHRYRHALDDGTGGWRPEPSAIRDGKALIARVRDAIVADDGTPASAPGLRACAAAIDAHGAVHPRVAAELVPSYVALARRLAALGDELRAVRLYERAVDAVPRYPRAHYWNGDGVRLLGFHHAAAALAAAEALLAYYVAADRPGRVAEIRAVVARLTRT